MNMRGERVEEEGKRRGERESRVPVFLMRNTKILFKAHKLG